MSDKEPIRIAMIMGKMAGGGVESIVLNYFRFIDKNKFQFDFICDEDSTYIPYNEIEKMGGKVILVPPYQKMLKYHMTLKKIFKNNNYQIVHSHINTLSVFSLFAAWRAKVKIRIAHNHATTSKKEWKRNIVKLVLRPLNRLFANTYAACSKKTAIWMFGEKNFKKGNVIIINNAIETNKFCYNEIARKRLRDKYKINDSDFVIGQVGRIMQTKNQLFTLNLLKKMQDDNKFKLVFVGIGPMEEELKNEIDKCNLNDRVILTGQVSNVYDYYNMFDLFILPSYYEGFGMALLEAQVTNLPAIVSTGVPLEAKIADNVEFVDLDDKIEVWIEKIKQHSNDMRLDNSYLLVNKGYDISTECKKLEEFYSNLLRGEK